MGISYAVVTKVKELTEARRYGEALDLLEGEDIFQSFNPQFLRCCGEVFFENNQLYESREALVRAHIMAPEGSRIIYDLVRLYLKMGYFQRANRYYEVYVHNSGPEDTGRLYLLYMIQKAQRVEASELLGILEKACEEQYSDEWGFELALLYASLGMRDKMKEECIHLMAAFRNSPYCALAESLKKGEYDISNSNFRFPIMEAEEDVETYASIIALEESQLEKDELKVHPPTPVILQMEDDDGTEKGEQGIKEKVLGFKLPFGKKLRKQTEVVEPKETVETMNTISDMSNEKSEQDIPSQTVEADNQLESRNESEVAIQTSSDETVTKESQSETSADEEDVSAYIESVMKSVADIEASVAEEMQHSIQFQEDADAAGNKYAGDDIRGTSIADKPYQPKLFDVEENLSPKERLEQLMKLIEEDRKSEEKVNPVSKADSEEELDLDEFLMNLVGANTITEAMVKSYREEKESEK